LNKNLSIEYPFYRPPFFNKSFLNNEYNNDYRRKAVHILGSGFYDILLCEFCLLKGISNVNLKEIFASG